MNNRFVNNLFTSNSLEQRIKDQSSDIDEYDAEL